MKVKTSELTGIALDWAVAKVLRDTGVDWTAHNGLRYSTDPTQAWPIIDRERIGTWPSDSIEGMWAARPDHKVYPGRLPPAYGHTSLIAAMRCYVASKLGDEVEIPDELI